MKLDLACGQRVRDGFIGVDLKQRDGVTHIVDLFRFPWPFESESCDELHCSHFVEHTPDLIAFMDECYRILKVGATIKIIAPYYTSIRAVQDPTHTRFICEATFAYFNRAWREREHLDHYDIQSHFELSHMERAIHPDFARLPMDQLHRAMLHSWNVIEDISVILTKLP